MCRNVMIYFNRDLQARVHALFLDSLVRLGFLCLGAKESLKYQPYESSYRDFVADQRIYRRFNP
jgi:chemotaxis protein methyltransferase CheR